jgi:hypothetical protein
MRKKINAAPQAIERPPEDALSNPLAPQEELNPVPPR